MNKLARRITAAGMCAALSLGSVCAAFAQPAGRRSTTAAAAGAGAQQPAEKEETVYVLAGADGSTQEIIVSDWLKNPDGSAALYDSSELTDIENVKGDEGFTASGSTLVWDAQGEDIYYQGRTEKELPVSLKVTYSLDGRTVTAEELAGKSGKVVIRFDYESCRYETVEINGTREKIYVPFAALTGVVLDNSVFGNVEISNGKLINDGDRTIAVGLAFPGLQADIAPDSENSVFPDYVEITADVSQMELGMTVTLLSNELFDAADTEKLDAAALLSALTEGVQALLDGSSELYDGLCTLLDSAYELSAGVDSIVSGAGELASGGNALGSGAAELSTGAESLVSGLNTLSANSAGLNSGAQQVFSGLLSMAYGQIRAAGISIPDLTAENYAEVLDGVISSVDANAAQTVTALKASLDSCSAFYLGLLTYTGGVDAAASGAAELSVGADSVKEGADRLSAGASALYSGALTMQGSIPALIDGITALRDGAMELSDGLRQLSEEGVQKLTQELGGDPDSFAARLSAAVTAAKNYRNFSGPDSTAPGQVRFVWRTDGIKQK